MTVILRRIDPAHIEEINRLAGLLEAARLDDVIELVCDRLFRGRRLVQHETPLGDYLPIDPSTLSLIATLTAAIEAAPSEDGKRSAALRVLNSSIETRMS